jgi:hypothetical protein
MADDFLLLHNGDGALGEVAVVEVRRAIEVVESAHRVVSTIVVEGARATTDNWHDLQIVKRRCPYIDKRLNIPRSVDSTLGRAAAEMLEAAERATMTMEANLANMMIGWRWIIIRSLENPMSPAFSKVD